MAKGWPIAADGGQCSQAAGRGGKIPTEGGGYPSGGHKAATCGRKAVKAATAEHAENVRRPRLRVSGKSAGMPAAALGRIAEKESPAAVIARAKSAAPHAPEGAKAMIIGDG